MLHGQVVKPKSVLTVRFIPIQGTLYVGIVGINRRKEKEKLCPFLTWKPNLKGQLRVFSGRMFPLLLEENPVSKNILTVGWLVHSLKRSQRKITLSFTLRKECKCLVLCEDLIPRLCFQVWAL